MSDTEVGALKTVPACFKVGYLSPEWPLVRHWQNFNTFCVVLTCILLPYIFALGTSESALISVGHSLDVIFVFDMIILFFTAYRSEGILITNRKAIAKNYIFSLNSPFKFSLDLVSALPFEFLALALSTAIGREPLWLEGVLRLNHLLRFYRISSMLGLREQEISSNSARIRGLRYLIFGVLLTHYIACGWYALACTSQTPTLHSHCHYHSWVHHNGFLNITNETVEWSITPLRRYVISLYWSAATVTSIGYGDIISTNTGEMRFAIVAMLAGIAMFFGVLLGGITSILTNLDSRRAKFLHRFNAVKSRMKDTSVPYSIQKIVKRIFEYCWEKQKGFENIALFASLHRSTQADIALISNEQFLKGVALFQDDIVEVGFKRMISLAIHHELYMPGQFIFKRGNLGEKVYYLHKGLIEVLTDDDQTTVAFLEEGVVLGELHLIYALPKTASARAVTSCYLWVLDRSNARTILSYYPGVEKRLVEVLKQRCVTAVAVSRTVPRHKQGSAVMLRKLDEGDSLKHNSLSYPFGDTRERSVSIVSFDEAVIQLEIEDQQKILVQDEQKPDGDKHNIVVPSASQKWSRLATERRMSQARSSMQKPQKPKQHESLVSLHISEHNFEQTSPVKTHATSVVTEVQKAEKHRHSEPARMRQNYPTVIKEVRDKHKEGINLVTLSDMKLRNLVTQKRRISLDSAGRDNEQQFLAEAQKREQQEASSDPASASTNIEPQKSLVYPEIGLLHCDADGSDLNVAKPEDLNVAKPEDVDIYQRRQSITYPEIDLLKCDYDGDSLAGEKVEQVDVEERRKSLVYPEISLLGIDVEHEGEAAIKEEPIYEVPTEPKSAYIEPKAEVFIKERTPEAVKLKKAVSFEVAPGSVTKAQANALKSHIEGMNQLLLEPDSRFTKLWERLIVLLALYVFFFYTYVACFPSLHGHKFLYEEHGGPIALLFTYLVESFFVADIIVQMRTAVISEHRVFRDWQSIKRNYLMTVNFAYDLLSVIPFEIVAIVMHDPMPYLTYLKLNRLLKLWKVEHYFKKLENRLDVSLSAVRTVRFLIYILAITHIGGCLWYLIAGKWFTGPAHAHEQSWLYWSLKRDIWLTLSEEQLEILEIEKGASTYYRKGAMDGAIADFNAPSSMSLDDDDENDRDHGHEEEDHQKSVNGTGSIYAVSLYWAAVTLSSLGYGDITPHAIYGYIVAIIVMFAGVLLYGFVLAYIAAYAATADAARVKYQTMVSAIKKFMSVQKLKPGLQKQVVAYMTQIWYKYRGEELPGTRQKIYSDLPSNLQQDIAISEAALFLELPFFCDVDVKFLRQLLLKSNTYIFSAGQIIIYAGDVAEEMYLLRRGICTLLTNDLKDVIAEVGPGQAFGELALLVIDYSPVTIRAKTAVDVIMISRSSFETVCEQFPLVKAQFQRACLRDDWVSRIRNQSLVHNSARTPVRSTLDLIKDAHRSREEIPLDHILSFKLHKDNSDYNVVFQTSPARFVKYLLMRRTFLPNGKFITAWQIMRVGVAILHMVIVPIHASLLYKNIGLWIFAYILDLVSAADIYVKLHTCYYNSQGRLVSHPLATAKNYLRTNFMMDFFSTLPIEFIAFGLHPETDANGAHVLTLFRMNRLLHFYQIPLAFSFLESGVGFDTVRVREVKYTFLSVIFINLFTCLFFNLACPPNPEIFAGHSEHEGEIENVCGENSWLSAIKFTNANENENVRYVVSLYWASATAISVGYGDITPQNMAEIAVSIPLIVGGVVFFGYIIAKIAASMANADAHRTNFHKDMTILRKYCAATDLPDELTDRAVGHFEFVWCRTNGITPKKMFNFLPPSLLGDVSLALYNNVINEVPEFKGVDLSFRKLLAKTMKPLYVMKGEYIIRKHDVGLEMFFIYDGVASVYDEDTGERYSTMGVGDFFGEIAVLHRAPRNATVIADTNCDLFVLHKDNLDRVMSRFPEVRKKVFKTADVRSDFQKKREPGCLVQSGVQIPTKLVGIPRRVTFHRPTTTVPGSDDTIGFFHIVLDPEFWFVRVVNMTSACAMVVSFVYTTYQAAFQDHNVLLYLINYLCEAVIMFKVIINTRTAFMGDKGELVMDIQAVQNAYVKRITGLPFDLLAFFPVDVFALLASHYRLRILSYLRLYHLIRFPRLLQFFSHWEAELNANLLLMRILKFTTLLFLLMHIFACGWFLLACPVGFPSCYNDTWFRNILKILHDVPPDRAYMMSLYWSISTMTSTGYGDIHAYGQLEMIFASITMVVGKLMFGFILGNISSTLSNRDSVRSTFEEHVKCVKKYMKDHRFLKNFRRKVLSQFNYIWEQNLATDPKTVLSQLPPCLWAEMQMHICYDMMQQVSFFSKEKVGFFRMLSLKMSLRPFLPGRYIFQKGDTGTEMYFIREGEVEITVGKDRSGYPVTLRKGDHFGKESVVLHVARRSYARALTIAQLFILTREDCEKVFRHFPNSKKRVLEIAKEEFGLDK